MRLSQLTYTAMSINLIKDHHQLGFTSSNLREDNEEHQGHHI